ncbi:hypothetical protein N9903_00180 [bacterium]|nr:hypothetical protein [bacterium]
MKKFTAIMTLMVLGMFLTSPVLAGPSSKFAAHVSVAGDSLHLLHSGKATAVVSGTEVTGMKEECILEATIKTANKSDLLIGVSMQDGLYTMTKVKGKNGSVEVAGAEGGIEVWLEIDGDADSHPVYPEIVTFARRFQELSATLGGVIESCDVTVTATGSGDTWDGTSTGTIYVPDDCEVSDEEIGLILDTTSADHFNFVAPNLDPGDHTVRVCARAKSSAEFTNGSWSYCPVDRNPDGLCPVDMVVVETTNNEAQGYALVDVGVLTVEKVRAINQAGGIIIDTDAQNGCYDDTGAYVCGN